MTDYRQRLKKYLTTPTHSKSKHMKKQFVATPGRDLSGPLEYLIIVLGSRYDRNSPRTDACLCHGPFWLRSSKFGWSGYRRETEFLFLVSTINFY